MGQVQVAGNGETRVRFKVPLTPSSGVLDGPGTTISDICFYNGTAAVVRHRNAPLGVMRNCPPTR